MAGHSKWANIQHRKGRQDAARSKLFSKLSKEITVAAMASLASAASDAATVGSAWFDEITIKELGPADESVTEPLSVVLNHVMGRVAGANKTADVPDAALLNAVTLALGTIPDVMKYDKAELTVKAGHPVRLLFTNSDHMPHNWLLLAPGSLETIGAMADQMLADPRAQARNYIPESPNVLFSAPMVNPNERVEVFFQAPSTPGRYPYVCTFPGHWRLMQGVLIVIP